MKAVYNLPHLIAWMMGRKQDRTETKKVCTCQRRPLTPEERYVKSLCRCSGLPRKKLGIPCVSRGFLEVLSPHVRTLSFQARG